MKWIQVQFGDNRRMVTDIESVDCRFLAVLDLTSAHVEVVRDQEVIEAFLRGISAVDDVSVVLSTRALGALLSVPVSVGHVLLADRRVKHICLRCLPSIGEDEFLGRCEQIANIPAAKYEVWKEYEREREDRR